MGQSADNNSSDFDDNNFRIIEEGGDQQTNISRKIKNVM